MSFSQSLAPENMDQFFVNADDEKWSTIALIGRQDTGFPRNHNAGLLADPYAWVEADDALQVLYSVSMTKEPNNSLWTYRIHQYEIPMGE